jgi:hypothetical protein
VVVHDHGRDAAGREGVVPRARLRVHQGHERRGGDVHGGHPLEVRAQLPDERPVLGPSHDAPEGQARFHARRLPEEEGQRRGGGDRVGIRVVVREHEDLGRVLDRPDEVG